MYVYVKCQRREEGKKRGSKVGTLRTCSVAAAHGVWSVQDTHTHTHKNLKFSFLIVTLSPLKGGLSKFHLLDYTLFTFWVFSFFILCFTLKLESLDVEGRRSRFLECSGDAED